MSWTTVIWSMSAGICLALAALHILLWLRGRNAQASLAFSLWATAVAISALFELAMMHSPTQERYAVLLGTAAFPFAVMTIAYIVFIQLYLRAGRRWLMWLIFGIVALELLVKVTVLPTLPFVEIADLRHIPLWGETLVAPVGGKSPWSWITGLLVMSELAFIGNAAFEAWRGDRRRQVKIVAVAVCCSTSFSVAIAILVMRAELPPPITVTLPAMFTILVMAYGLIAEFSQMSQDLRASQERMRLAGNAADLELWEWDIVRDEIRATEEVRRRIGASESERIVFQRFLQSVHPDDREPTHRAVYQAIEGGREFQAEYRSVTPEEAIRWIAARGQVVRGPNGKPLLLRGISVDITERKRAEEALQISEEKFRQFFKNTPDYCYIVSMEGKILHINESALKILGYTRAELVGQPLARIYAPESLAKMKALFGRWKETGKIRDEEMVILTKKGEKRAVILNAGAVKDKDGKILHSTSVQTDITERRRAEAEIARAQAELLRTERSSRLSELTASLAHELNQPLTAILSNAQAALLFLKSDKPDLNELREIISDIISDDQRAGSLIHNLRSLMKREEGRKQPTILNDVANDVIRIFRSEAIFRRVQIESQLDASLPRVLGDKVQLQQVVLNIVLNGAEAMSQNAPERKKLILRTHRSDQNVRLTVRDFGPGIDEGNLERIFQPFFTTKGEGFGMGLAVCSSIVKNHGGRIWAENNPDGGAMFFIELPVFEGGQ